MQKNFAVMARGFLMAFVLAVLSGPVPVWAEVSVTARVDRTTLAPGESLQLEVTVNGGKAEADLSGMRDFKIISQGSSSSIQIINGTMSRQETNTYLLIPQRTGRLTIPALPVTVDNRVYQSEPIVITVKDQPPAADNNARDQEVWISVEVSDPTPYQGQQITYIFRLHSRVQIDNANFQPPEFDGFSSKEIKDRRSYRKIINGREHIITEVYFILTPLSAGPCTIEPAVLQLGIVRQNTSRRNSPFDSFFNRATIEPKVLQSEAISVQVKPLPPLSSDRQFSGLVGRFDLKAEIESPSLKVGDSATLAITIAGRGNIMDARAPDLKVPGAFKAYTDNPQEEIDQDRTGFHGKKVFRTALVPLETGTFDLPPVTLTYFDPDQKDYRTVLATPPTVTVTPAQEPAQGPVAVTPEPLKPLKKAVDFTGRDILPPRENLTAVQSRAPLAWPFFILALLIPALCFGIVVCIQHLRHKDTSPAAMMKAKARTALNTAQKSTAGEFLTLLYQALTAAILASGGRAGEALTWKEAEQLLLNCGHSAHDARQVAGLLSQIESAKFSGQTPSPRQQKELLAQTRQTVRKLIP